MLTVFLLKQTNRKKGNKWGKDGMDEVLEDTIMG